MKADLVLKNARIITPEEEIRGSVAIKGGRILGIGEDFSGREIDCGGKFLIPGIIDPHIHFSSLAKALASIDLSGSRSIGEIKERIREGCGRAREGEWIRGWGYDEFFLKEKRHPTRWDLDEVSPLNPVKIVHRTGRAVVLNSKALSMLGISFYTPDPEGGIIDRDFEKMEPTGVLFGIRIEDDGGDFEKASQVLLSFGIKFFEDASVNNSPERIKKLLELKRKGVIKQNIKAMLGSKYMERLGDADRVKIEITSTRGYIEPSFEKLKEVAERARALGYKLAIHAMERDEVMMAVKLAEEGDRIEHCSICPPEALRFIREKRLMVITNPGFIYWNGEKYKELVSPGDRPYLYLLRSFIKNGVLVGVASDAPAIPPSPFPSIFSAITRKTKEGSILNPDEALSPFEALKLVTKNPAIILGEERGEIREGKRADLVLIDKFPPDPDDKALMTIIDGRIVYEI